MITLGLTGKERLQFQYILPNQGSISTLEMVENILNKVKIDDIKDVNDNKNVKEFNFEDQEIDLMLNMVSILDQQQQLPLTSLSLVKKIFNTKEKN